MKKPKESSYSVAMSKETGCIVMVRSNGKGLTVCGSMTREESLQFVRSIMEWADKTIKEEAPRIQRLNG